MSIKIQARGFRLTSALKDYARTKLEKALERFQGQSKAEVTLQDINGPRGGEDMRCKIILTLKGKRPLIIQETAEDMYDAIAIATSRARWSINRQLDKVRTRKRKVVVSENKVEFDTDDFEEAYDSPRYIEVVSVH